MDVTEKQRVLFLSTWFPYPPTHGSKLRAYYLLKGLAQRHEVALVTFEDQPLQPAWVEHMRQICARVEVLPNHPFASNSKDPKLDWLSPQPAVARRIYNPQMAALVQRVAQEWQPQAVLALTYATAPYALPSVLPGPHLLRVVDIDNLMYRMLFEAYQARQLRSSPSRRQPSSTLARLRRWLAYQKFIRYERWLYNHFDLCLVVTPEDGKAAQEWLGLPAAQLSVVANGVDTAYNQPYLAPPQPDTLVYNGALTYAANFDAMAYFLRDIFPLVLVQRPSTRLRITGSTQGVALERLPLNSQVELTGFVEDVRPVVAESWCCVVPLQMGGGTRLKVLEAMALGTPVVSTSKGVEGLEVIPNRHVLLADTPAEFAQQVLYLLETPNLRSRLACEARQLVQERYEWSEIGKHLAGLLAVRPSPAG